MKSVKQLIMLALLMISIFSFNNGEKVNVIADHLSYYSEIFDLNGELKYEGKQLRSKLHDIISEDTKNYSYDDLAWIYHTTDVSLTDNTKVKLYYTGEERFYDFSTFGDSINREHVWCQSHFGNSVDLQNSPYSDAHQIRPCDSSLNSSRNNSFYDELDDSEIKHFDNYGNVWNGSTFFPSEKYRGDVARILFYVATRYYDANSEVLSYNNLDFADNANIEDGGDYTYKMGNISTLLKWNILYGVNDDEKRRNDEVEKIQYNRNPFIDYPELAVAIWKDFSPQTKTVVEEYTYDILFDTRGGSNVDSQQVLYNYCVKEPEVPTKHDVSFLGWYEDLEFTKKYDFSNKVTNDIVLYARWSDGVTTAEDYYSSLKTETSLSYFYSKEQDDSTLSTIETIPFAFADFTTGNGNVQNNTGYYYSNVAFEEGDAALSQFSYYKNVYKARKGKDSNDHLLKVGKASEAGVITIKNSKYLATSISFYARSWNDSTTIGLENAVCNEANSFVVDDTLKKYSINVINQTDDVTIKGISGGHLVFYIDDIELQTDIKWSFNNIIFRYRTIISEPLYQQLGCTDFGILVSKRSNLTSTLFTSMDTNSFNNFVNKNNSSIYPIDKNNIEFVDGNYIVAGSIDAISDENLKDELTAVIYLNKDGYYYFNKPTTYSVTSIINVYLGNSLVEEEIIIESLKVLKEKISLL